MTFPDRQATGLNLTSQGFVYMAIMILMLPFSFFVINILGYKLMYNTVQNVFWLLQFETVIFNNTLTYVTRLVSPMCPDF